MTKRSKDKIKVKDVTPGHSKYGPSKASRWLYCHASIHEEAKYPNVTTKYAEEGTCAHRLAQLCLSDRVNGRKRKPAWYVGKTCDETGLEYDDDMADAVIDYIDIVMGEYDSEHDEILIEQKLHCPDVHEDLYGTADCIILKPRKVVTIDFKYGKGVIVDATENEQMLTYTLMVSLAFSNDRKRFKQIIVQPRVDDHEKRVTTWEYGTKTLRKFRDRVDESLSIIEEVSKIVAKKKAIPEKYYAPGEKRCHFCRASGNCKPQDKYILKAMQQDYEYISDDSQFDAPAAASMDANRLRYVLTHRKAISGWLDAVLAHAIAELQRDSRTIPEFKVVHGRSNRRWKKEFKDDREKFIKKLLKVLPSLDTEDLINTQLKTVRQIESVIKNDEDAIASLEKFWEKPPGKLTLVSVDDGRKGISSLDDYM